MKIFILSLFVFLLSGCGGETKEVIKEVEIIKEVEVIKEVVVEVPAPEPDPLPLPKMLAEWTGYYSSWWEIPQYYNGIPKYSAAKGTYTHKHQYMAVYRNGMLFSVRTDNTEDENFYVYVMKDGVSVKVHTILNWDDPHTNASINLDDNGYVWVHIASRGLAHKFQSGKILKSKTPYELDFECVDGCSDLNINYEAYPQVHNTAWGMHLIYTRYEQDYEGGINQRRLWSRAGGERVKLSKLAHYSVSNFDSVSNKLCVASNTLINGLPDKRVNLSVICTDQDGNWYKSNGDPVNFSQIDESDRVVYETESWETFVYLKDIISIDGKLRVLFVESSTSDPTKGHRYLKEWIQGEGVKIVAYVGHNYSAGSYIEKNDELYIALGQSAVQYYLSGIVELYNSDYDLIDTLEDGGEYSYIRRVIGTDGMAVMSRGRSDVKERGQHYILTLQ